MKAKCVVRLAFFEVWCQKAFGKIPDSSKYRKSDQIWETFILVTTKEEQITVL